MIRQGHIWTDLRACTLGELGVFVRAAIKHEGDKIKLEMQIKSLERLANLHDMRVAQHAEAKDFKTHANDIASHHKRIATEGQPVPVSNRDKILERKRRMKK